MNKRIKKKIAKRQIQEKQEELEKQLRKLSPEEIEAIAKMINQAVSNIRKAFSQMLDNLFTFLKTWRWKLKKLSDEELKTLDRELFKFQNIQRTIDLRRLELETRNPDAQSGSTVGISKPTETIAIRIADDPTLKFLEGFKGIINKLLSNLVDEDIEIFNLRWRYPQLRWEEIAEQKFMSKATIYRRRRIILEQYAILKGEL